MNDIRLTFNSMPSMVAIYPKLLLRSKPALVPDGASVPTIEARMDIVSTRPDKIVAYNKVCGFPDSDYLPITYPHVLAMPLHLQILSNEAFPARVMGLVHIENTITRYGLVPDQEILSIRCFIEGHTETDAGQLFAMNTVVSTRDSVRLGDLGLDGLPLFLRDVSDDHLGALPGEDAGLFSAHAAGAP